MGTIMVGGGQTVAPCTTAQDAETDADSLAYDFGKTSGDVWIATKFVAGNTDDGVATANYTACSAAVQLEPAVAGSGSETIRACIYSDDATDDPNALIGSCSDTVTISSLSSGSNTVSFLNMSASLTDGTTYWLVLYTSGYHATNYVKWWSENSETTAYITYDGNGSGDWAEYSTSRSCKYTLYSE